ncbi:unnamed protein product, partial [Mesorhabditis belari]|uniref:Domain of unknown function DB domain-containing protein n=1 Tax=Mesorhabditis belari TaxID=2138241 RepID=A0AAF3J5Z8_9BILA
MGGCGFLGGCLPTISLPSISFGCGRFCRRAKGAKTISGEDIQQLPGDEIQEEPDVMFQKCCQEARIPGACLNKCSFRTYTKEALTSMFFKTDSCPVEAAIDIHRCAAQLNDHRECCSLQGIEKTLAGPKCQIFCDLRPTPNATRLDPSYLPCLERFENIKSCFWNDANRRHLDYMQKAHQEGSIDGEGMEIEEFEAEAPHPFYQSPAEGLAIKRVVVTGDDREKDSSHEVDEDDIEVQMRRLNRNENRVNVGDSPKKQQSIDQHLQPNNGNPFNKPSPSDRSGKPWYMYEEK